TVAQQQSADACALAGLHSKRRTRTLRSLSRRCRHATSMSRCRGDRMTWYETAIQILLIGIANGSIIALVALGYTLVYGIIELINFAHGDVFMIGTMVSLTLVTWVPSLLGVRQAGLLPPLTLLGLIAGSLLASIVVCATLNV